MPRVQAELSEKLVGQLFSRAIGLAGAEPFASPASGGVLWLGASGRIKVLGCGGVQLEAGNTMFVSELDLTWPELKVSIGLDIPSIPFGGFCVFPLPGGGCIRMKRYTLFPGEPDIGPLTLDLSPILSLLVSEVSGRFSIDVRKNAIEKRHEVYVRPDDIDVDPVDLSGTAGQLGPLLHGAIVAVAAQQVNAMLPGGWLLDLALRALGVPTAHSLVLDLLDIGDDVEEWLMEVLNESIGLPNLVWDALFTAVLADTIIAKVEDPYPVAAETTLPSAGFGGFASPPPAGVPITEVGVPLGDLAVSIHEDRLVVTIDLVDL